MKSAFLGASTELIISNEEVNIKDKSEISPDGGSAFISLGDGGGGCIRSEGYGGTKPILA